jgi:hypothetical protein
MDRAKGYHAGVEGDGEQGPFEAGACYEVVASFEALRDRFVEGERMWYFRSAYSRFDGMHGFFFRQPGWKVRSWDVSLLDEARSEWQARFRRVAPPHPLIEAARDGRPSGIDLEALGSIAEIDRELALEAAAERDHAGFVGALLDAAPTSVEHGRRLFASAARAGSSEVVAAMIARGAAADEPDPHGQTPLFGAVTSGDVATVELLLDAGADPDHVSNSGTSPVRLARAWKHDAVVLLIEGRRRSTEP